MSRESYISRWAPKQLTFEGSIDDVETLKEILHWAEKVDFSSFKPDEPKQVVAVVEGTKYYICQEDIGFPVPEFGNRLKKHRDRRWVLDRRHQDRTDQSGRRSSDHPTQQEPSADED